jgi:uncharacterized SAM-dependent methyltransferase
MALINVTIHSSQYPENVRRDLLESLRTRSVNHKCHYESYKQGQKWLALHEAFSPARTDPACVAIYDEAFRAVAEQTAAPMVQVIGLGCGGGQKDARLVRLLTEAGKRVSYRPSDVSLPLVLTASEVVSRAAEVVLANPLVFDLAAAGDLREIFPKAADSTAVRLFGLFGMIPNFEPGIIVPAMAALLDKSDGLLFSANLAPGPDYAAGMKRILPGYDNALTRDWLTTFLFDLGFEPADGTMRFAVEDSAQGYQRIAAYFDLTRDRALSVYNERFAFRAGESIRLFFSYRYTPELLATLFGRHGILVSRRWMASSGEEGVFFCQKEYN